MIDRASFEACKTFSSCRHFVADGRKRARSANRPTRHKRRLRCRFADAGRLVGPERHRPCGLEKPREKSGTPAPSAAGGCLNAATRSLLILPMCTHLVSWIDRLPPFPLRLRQRLFRRRVSACISPNRWLASTTFMKMGESASCRRISLHPSVFQATQCGENATTTAALSTFSAGAGAAIHGNAKLANLLAQRIAVEAKKISPAPIRGYGHGVPDKGRNMDFWSPTTRRSIVAETTLPEGSR